MEYRICMVMYIPINVLKVSLCINMYVQNINLEYTHICFSKYILYKSINLKEYYVYKTIEFIYVYFTEYILKYKIFVSVDKPKEFSVYNLKHFTFNKSPMSKIFWVGITTLLPHCIEEGTIVYQSEQFVGCGHIMSHWFLAIMEEGVRSPYLTSQKIVQWKDLHGSIKFQSFIMPCLSKKYINSIFLEQKKQERSNVSVGFWWESTMPLANINQNIFCDIE